MFNTPALGSAPIGSSPFRSTMNRAMNGMQPQGYPGAQPKQSPFSAKAPAQARYSTPQYGGLASILGYGNMAADTAAGSTPTPTAPPATPTTPAAPVIPPQPSYVPHGTVLQGDALVPIPGYVPQQPSMTPEQSKLMALLGSNWMNGGIGY